MQDLDAIIIIRHHLPGGKRYGMASASTALASLCRARRPGRKGSAGWDNRV